MQLYEQKLIQDKDFPVQILENHVTSKGEFCPTHWHEHVEMHYILNGTGTIYIGQKPHLVGKGDLVIINESELHSITSNSNVFEGVVVIFPMDAFSQELANCNVVFESLIQNNDYIQALMRVVYREEKEKENGYKMAIRGKLYDLITYLFRSHVLQTFSSRENEKRLKKMEQLNSVLQYMNQYFMESVTNAELAEVAHLSEGRFCHLFKESMGVSPLFYMNEIRLKKAHALLRQKNMNITEIAMAVGFRDFNHFGRLFKQYYGYTPSQVWKNRELPEDGSMLIPYQQNPMYA